jgi:cytochrome c-type biogenesis protein CcmH/NrfG
MALQAKELFERVLKLNPANDSAKIQLGSCYIFGNISETPMEGIRMVREVAERDPQNMYAQHILGMGAVFSGQFDKAIERFLTVAQKEPENVEAKLLLAESYERTGDTLNAIKWYQASLQLVKQKQFAQEIEKRINSLKSN